MQFSITIPEPQIKKLEAAIGTQSTKQAIYQAVKRTTRAGANIIQKRVQEVLHIDTKYVRRAVTSRVVGGEVSSVGHIEIADQSMPLIAYADSRMGSGGVTIQVWYSRPARRLRHAFYATVKNPVADGGFVSHKGIFFRAEGRDKSGGKKDKQVGRNLKVGRYVGGNLTPTGYARRLPIEQLLGPSVVFAIGKEQLTVTGQNVMSDLAGVFQKNIESQLNRFLGRTKAEAAEIAADVASGYNVTTTDEDTNG